MAESDSHKRAKRKAACRTGKTEAPLRVNRRLDALTAKKAVEIERRGAEMTEARRRIPQLI